MYRSFLAERKRKGVPKTKTGHPLRRLVKRQNVTGLNFFLVEFLLPAEILFSGAVRS